MTPTIYAAEANPTEHILTTITDWISANRLTFWTAAAGAALCLFALAIYLTAGALKGRDRNAKAAIGYAIVQIGMAYVTITGGYDFWHLVAHMPPVEAAALAIFIEAAQWYAIGKTFEWMAQHTDGNPHLGYGRPGIYFWLFVTGGSLLAILGAFLGQHNGPLSVGRTVAVVIGSLLWDLLLRERMHRDATIPPTVLLLTWRKIGIRLGIVAAEKKDVQNADREYVLRRMSRALRWKNEGNKLLRWMGVRYLMRAMDAGDAPLLHAASVRYAMNWVLRTEVTAGHKTMSAAIDAARQVLNPPTVVPLELNMPEPPPTVRVAPVRRTRPASINGASNSSTAELRERAVRWAAEQLSRGERLTAARVAAEFGAKDEWGRLRLREAEARLADAA